MAKPPWKQQMFLSFWNNFLALFWAFWVAVATSSSNNSLKCKRIVSDCGGWTSEEREKMICSILLLINLTSCVCGTFVVNVTQSSYQAEDNQNIILEWTFTTRTPSSPDSLFIFCELYSDSKFSTLFHLHEGVEVPESQDEQFVGRVQWDKDVLREGRIRLHVSRLRTDDSGPYLCEVTTDYGWNSGKCQLTVTAARDWPEPETEPETEPEIQNTASWVRIVLTCAGGLTAAAAVLNVCYRLLVDSRPGGQESCVGFGKSSNSAGGLEETV